MTIQIEEGTYYRTHGGRKVGPLVEIEPDRDPPLQFDAWSDGSDTWDADGAHCDDSKCDDTIVAEWADDQAAIDRLAAIVADEKLPPGVRVDAADSMWRARPTGSFSTQMTDAEIVAAIEAAEASLAGQTRGDFDRDRDRANREVFETAPAPQTAAGVGRAPPEPAPDKADVKAEIADEAKRIVSGARRTAYGTPENNFGRIARLWNSHLVNVGILDADVMGDPEAKGGITPGDVSLMMALMKIARLAETPDHRDSYVDLVGYALTGAEVNGVQPLTPDKPQA